MRTPCSPVPLTFVLCARGSPHSPCSHRLEGLVTEGWPSRLEKAGRGRFHKELPSKWSRPSCRMLGKDQTSWGQSWERFVALAHCLGYFYSCQGDVLCLPTLAFLDLSSPSPDSQHTGATLGSACPGIPIGGKPDGQHGLAVLPLSSLPFCSHSCLGQCPCPALLSGPSPVRFWAPAGQVPCHCPVPFRF